MLSLSPRGVLRGAVIFCLIGFGVSAIYQASHIGPRYDRLGIAHDLAFFFLIMVPVFVLLYGEYRMAQWLGKRELNAALGYVQAVGCLLILFFGILAIFNSHGTQVNSLAPGGADNALLAILVFGHAVFLTNVIWSYIRESRLS